MKQINEIIVLSTVITDENTFLSPIDVTISTYNKTENIQKRYQSVIWDSRTDSVCILSGSRLDYFLEHTFLFKQMCFVDNSFDTLMMAE